jgi:hypothetical protein
MPVRTDAPDMQRENLRVLIEWDGDHGVVPALRTQDLYGAR